MNFTKPYNITESTLVKTGRGVITGININSHTNGTLKLIDGLYNGAPAVGTLTSSGACAPADYATATLTSTGAISDGETVTIDTIVYRFKSTPAQAYDVKIGASDAITLDNLKLAINGTGVGDGTDYYTGTVAHTTVIATTNTDTTQVIRARTIGTAANSIATTETCTNCAWGGATMSGGVATSAATITIDTITYTAVLTLAESIGLTAVANQVLWVTSEAVFLDNLKLAINATGLAGTDYGTGTVPHPSVIATTNTNTTQVVQARNIGSAGNSIATTETLGNYAWGGTTLASGTGPTGRVILNTNTFSAVATTGERFIPIPNGEFSTGLLAIIGGTADLTLFVD